MKLYNDGITFFLLINIMKKKHLLLIILLFILLYIYINKNTEKFVDYETERSYYFCKYGNDSASCNRYQHRRNTLENMVKLVGYVTNIKNNRKHKLYSYYNIDYNRHGYMIGVTKRFHNSDELKIELPIKIRDLFNNDIIDIPTMRGKYKVTLYDKQLQFSDYVNIPFSDIGYVIDNRNLYHRIYRRPINRFKYLHGYYNKNNIFIPLNEENELYDGDVIKMPTINNKKFRFYKHYW